MRMLITCAVLALLAGTVSAQTWDEWANGGGDAGGQGIATAQVTDGVGPLTTITGSLSSVTDEDVFGIRIVDEANFVADTDLVSWDTQLFLFNADGTGQVECDDHDGSSALINSDGVFSNGVYYLGITGFNEDPIDEFGVHLFSTETWPGSGTQCKPAQGNPYADFDDGGRTGSGDYTIVLTGAEFMVPEPGTLSLLALAAVAVLRRR